MAAEAADPSLRELATELAKEPGPHRAFGYGVFGPRGATATPNTCAAISIS
jgi:hypothetical protein